MKKKFVYILAILGLTIMMYGCGNESVNEQANTTEPTAISTTEPTTEEPTTVAPTTEAPTTVAPTTEEPTTEAPTTEAPTTEAPTTEDSANFTYCFEGRYWYCENPKLAFYCDGKMFYSDGDSYGTPYSVPYGEHEGRATLYFYGDSPYRTFYLEGDVLKGNNDVREYTYIEITKEQYDALCSGESISIPSGAERAPEYDFEGKYWYCEGVEWAFYCDGETFYSSSNPAGRPYYVPHGEHEGYATVYFGEDPYETFHIEDDVLIGNDDWDEYIYIEITKEEFEAMCSGE